MKDFSKYINVHLNYCCQNIRLLSYFCIIQAQISFSGSSFEMIWIEHDFPNCCCRIAKILARFLYFSLIFTSGSFTFSKFTNGSSYYGILRFEIIFEKKSLKSEDILYKYHFQFLFTWMKQTFQPLPKKHWKEDGVSWRDFFVFWGRSMEFFWGITKYFLCFTIIITTINCRTSFRYCFM